MERNREIDFSTFLKDNYFSKEIVSFFLEHSEIIEIDDMNCSKSLNYLKIGFDGNILSIVKFGELKNLNECTYCGETPIYDTDW